MLKPRRGTQVNGRFWVIFPLREDCESWCALIRHGAQSMFALTGTILDEEAPRARVAVLLKHFSQLGDDREPWRGMYPLKGGMLLIACATIAGCDDLDHICAWGRHHLQFLRGVL